MKRFYLIYIAAVTFLGLITSMLSHVISVIDNLPFKLILYPIIITMFFFVSLFVIILNKIFKL